MSTLSHQRHIHLPRGFTPLPRLPPCPSLHLSYHAHKPVRSYSQHSPALPLASPSGLFQYSTLHPITTGLPLRITTSYRIATMAARDVSGCFTFHPTLAGFADGSNSTTTTSTCHSYRPCSPGCTSCTLGVCTPGYSPMADETCLLVSPQLNHHQSAACYSCLWDRHPNRLAQLRINVHPTPTTR